MVFKLMQIALKLTQLRCIKENLLVNPDKAQLKTFTQKTRLEVLETPSLFGRRVKRTNEVKYMDLIQDRSDQQI